MKKKELLAPAGSFEALKQAVANGADAVYLGGKKFGARAFANNFTEEELIKAIKYCHLYGVKLYVTVNTIVYETEIEECIQYLRFLHQNNVDAVIMQDLGLIKRTRVQFPNLEIHASTQMHNHNQEQIKLLEKLGVKRVVLAREMSLEAINNLDTNLEIEAFIHGAICVCYSGECLFSSLLLDRSGNRGSCAQVCRLPYELIKDKKQTIKTPGNYLLSPKELNTLNQFQQLLNSNITSFKIEGRMKSPEYVGFITRLYRKCIDLTPESITEEEKKNLNILFNREFTNGFLFQTSNQELMNIISPNHQGIHLGKVLEIKNKKIKIRLDEDLEQEDGIRFKESDKGLIVNFLYNEKGLLINHANKGDIVYVDNKINLTTKDEVRKTLSHQLNLELANLPKKKIPVTWKVKARVGQPLIISISDGTNEIVKEGDIVASSLKLATTKQDIEEKIATLGNTPFVSQGIHFDLDSDIFIRLSELKHIKRNLVLQLTLTRENQIPHPFLEQERKTTSVFSSNQAAINRNALVRNEEQLKACLEEKINTIYVTEEKLYQKYHDHENIYLRLPRVNDCKKEYKKERLLVGETGSLYKYQKENKMRTDYYLNVVNSLNVQFLLEQNVEKITLSVEARQEDIKSLMQNIEAKDKIEIIIYGRPEVMITKYCPLNALVNKDKICHVCTQKEQYALKDRNGKLYPIQNELPNHLTHIFYYKPLNRLVDFENYKKMGIQNYRFEFFEETAEEIKSIIRQIN